MQQCGYVKSPENEEGLLIASSILQDATAAAQATNMKRKRSNDDLTSTRVSLSFISGEKVSSKRLKSKVSKRLGIIRKRLSTAPKLSGATRPAGFTQKSERVQTLFQQSTVSLR